MTLHLNPQLPARIALPTSKSISARALIISALADEPCPLVGLSDCDDTVAVTTALSRNPETVDIGAAGTAMRFLTAYYSTRVGEEHLLTGTERMKHRPIGLLVDALRQLGADIEYAGEEGYPPLRIRGRRLKGGVVSIAADVSSQYITALLMLGPTLAEGLRLELVGNISSRPYILMTLRLMEQFGAETRFEGSTISVSPGHYRRTEPYVVEPDWSAASYWYELVALSPAADAHVLLEGLTAASLQGDSVCADYFAHLGVKTTFAPEGALLEKSGVAVEETEVMHSKADTTHIAADTTHIAADTIHIEAEAGCAVGEPSSMLRLDFTDCPDLAQTFVVTAAVMGCPFRFDGLHSLRIKETDRIAALIAELAKCGIAITETAPGQLSYDGAAPAVPAAAPVIATYADHRMAMAFAPAAYLFPGLTIEHPEVVSKSYPHFWQDLPQR